MSEKVSSGTGAHLLQVPNNSPGSHRPNVLKKPSPGIRRKTQNPKSSSRQKIVGVPSSPTQSVCASSSPQYLSVLSGRQSGSCQGPLCSHSSSNLSTMAATTNSRSNSRCSSRCASPCPTRRKDEDRILRELHTLFYTGKRYDD